MAMAMDAIHYYYYIHLLCLRFACKIFAFVVFARWFLYLLFMNNNFSIVICSFSFRFIIHSFIQTQSLIVDIFVFDVIYVVDHNKLYPSWFDAKRAQSSHIPHIFTLRTSLLFLLLVRPYLSSFGHVHCSHCLCVCVCSRSLSFFHLIPLWVCFDIVFKHAFDSTAIRTVVAATTTKRNLLFLSLFLLVYVFYLWLWFFSLFAPIVPKTLYSRTDERILFVAIFFSFSWVAVIYTYSVNTHTKQLPYRTLFFHSFDFIIHIWLGISTQWIFLSVVWLKIITPIKFTVHEFRLFFCLHSFFCFCNFVQLRIYCFLYLLLWWTFCVSSL